MAKKIIRTGTTADPTGDSLKNAFVKVNDNFTELYNALGLDADLLNLGAFEFTGSVMTTTDSSAIVIDQAATITSNLSVGGDLLPQTALGGDLGSSTLPWRSLYVSNNTIYIGGTAVGLDANGNLTTGGTIVGSTPAWANITGKPTFATVATTGAYADLTGKPTIPTLVSQLSNDSGFLTSVSNIQSESDVSIQVNLTDSTTRIWRFGEDGDLTFPDGTTQATAYTGGGGTGTLTLVNNQIYPSVDNGGSVGTSGRRFNEGWFVNAVYVGNFGAEALSQIDGGRIFLTNTESQDPVKLFLNNVEFGNNSTALRQGLVITENVDGTIYTYLRANNVSKKVDFPNGLTGHLAGTTENIESENDVSIRINLSDSTTRIWQFGEDGGLTFPEGYLKIVPNGANPYISNIIDNGLGLVSGSGIQIRQSVADAYGISINSSTTDTSLGDGSLLASGSNIDVNGSKIILGQYVVNNLDANTGLTGQNKIEINNSAILIGLDVSTLSSGTTTSAFSGWTFDGQADTLTFPDATVQTTAWTGIANALRSETGIYIDVNLSDSTLRRWQFGEDGSLTLPSVGKINNGEYDWTFGTDGELALPNNGKITSGVDAAQVGSTTTIALNSLGTDQANNNINVGIEWTGNEAVFTTYAAGSTITFANGDVRTITEIQKNEVYGEPGVFAIDIYWSTGTPRENLTAFPITLKTSNYAAAYTAPEWQFGTNGVLTLPGILKIDDGVHEKFQTKADATGIVTHDCSLGHIFYHTSPDANWTANFTNLNLSTTYATSITLIIAQGATGYYPSAVQIAGSAQTINWQGNVNPTVSTSRTDVVTFSIINNSGTYTVLGQLTGF